MSVLIGGAGLVVFVAVMTLALRGELTFARGTPREIRLWLVAEPESQGLGFSTARQISMSNDGTQECDIRQVHFFLWRSEGPAPATAYCECYARAAQGWESRGECPPS
ncbi:MAG: hypothetical protein M1337_00440 [Actinobacteria bacterium]|nr:hypothetical protein [Actinomycetota bacterium]